MSRLWIVETDYECLECRAHLELVGLHVEHPEPVAPECRATLLGVPLQVVQEGAPLQ